jgi:hypothetical protein
MGLVAVTLGCLALGAYIGRYPSGGIGIRFFIAGFACVFGLNFASARGHDQLSTTLLFGLGLLLGLALGPVLNAYQNLPTSGAFVQSGRQDLNLPARPPRRDPGVGLEREPRIYWGFRGPVGLGFRRFSPLKHGLRVECVVDEIQVLPPDTVARVSDELPKERSQCAAVAQPSAERANRPVRIGFCEGPNRSREPFQRTLLAALRRVR